MRNFIIPLLLVFFVQADSASGSGGEEALSRLSFPPIKTDIPQPSRVTLKNGVRVLLLPDHELPLITVSAMIKTGAIYDPPGKEGLAALTGANIRSGGTVAIPPDELDEKLERMAAMVEVSIGEESGTATLSTLTKDLDTGLETFADVLRNPRFDESRFELSKAQTMESIRRENDDPSGIAMRELSHLLYEGTPYANRLTLKSVSSITIEDAKQFHRNYFVPQGMIIGVAGDFDEKSIIAKLEKVFEGWQGVDPLFPEVTPAPEKYEGGFFVADKKLPQAVIRAGHLATKRTNPDYFSLRVMDKILGANGFASRMVQKIRTERGLAYSAWSYYLGGRSELGRLLIGAETKTESVAEVVKIMIEEISAIREVEVTDDEIDVARNAIVNSFIFIFDKPARILDQWLTLEYYDYPHDYLLSYRDKVMWVTKGDVLRVAKKYLHPDGLKFVVVGDTESLKDGLSLFGEINEIELEDYRTGEKQKHHD